MAHFKEDTYVRLKLASYGLGHIFGISVIRWYPSGELEPYVVNVMEYIEKQMILSGATTLKQKLDAYDELYHNIMDQIIYGQIFDLLVAMGIPAGSNYYYNDNCCEDCSVANETHFITATVNFITSLYMQLRYNYSHLYLTPQTDCHSCSGNTTSYSGPDYSIPDPRPMQDGYEFGCGTQELWGPGLSNI